MKDANKNIFLVHTEILLKNKTRLYKVKNYIAVKKGRK